MSSSQRPLPTWAMFSAWMPALVGIAVIMCESTDRFSSANTSGPLRHVWEFIFGPVSNQVWLVVHHHIRKTGHAVGYGTLSALFFRAWHLTLKLFSRKEIYPWLISIVLALSSTLIIGSADEIHQKYIPSRSSSPLDVAVDMAGAIAVQLLIALFFMARAGARQSSHLEAHSES